MGGEVIAAGAEVGDFTQPADGPVPPVRCRDEGLQEDEFVSAAMFAVGAAYVVAVRSGDAVGIQPAPAGMLGCGARMRGSSQWGQGRNPVGTRCCGNVWAVYGWRHCRPIPNAQCRRPVAAASDSVRYLRIVVMGLCLTFNVLRIGHGSRVIKWPAQVLRK